MEKSYYIQSQKGCEYMLPIQIDLPKNFLEEEIRCGYKISSEMKKVWVSSNRFTRTGKKKYAKNMA